NAGNTPKDFAWASEHSRGDVRVEDHSARWALIAVQGPRAAALMAKLADPDPSDLDYYGFRETKVEGAPTLVSRTGYTGEDGFEVVDRGIARHGYPAKTSAGPGVVTSGTHSPTLGKPIGLALLPTAATTVATEFEVEIRGRAAGARIVPTPFYKRKEA